MRNKFFLAVLCLMLFVGGAYAAVVIESSGTEVGKAETLNFVGPTVAVSGKDATITTTGIAGNSTVTGTLTVSDDLYGSTDVFVDGSIYFTDLTGAGTLWLHQSDGGCSRCQVDAAGTTFSCANATCPSGM